MCCKKMNSVASITLTFYLYNNIRVLYLYKLMLFQMENFSIFIYFSVLQG